MNWTDLSVSLFVVLAPTAGRCDSAGPSAALAAAQSGDAPESAAGAPDEAPENAAPENAAGAPDEAPESVPAPPEGTSASESAPPTQGPPTQPPPLSPTPWPTPDPDVAPPGGPPPDNGIATQDVSTQGDWSAAQSTPSGPDTTAIFPWGPGASSIQAPARPDEAPGWPDEAPGVAPDQASPGEGADSYSDTDPSALTDFRAALDPYGNWADDPTVGDVWVPSPQTVGQDFTPYVSAGHWTYDGDWIWASDYSWGWVPFHYGRWIFIDGRGWSWVPGRAYRGAWVAWAVDAAYAYVGWEPMAPSFVWIRGAAVSWAAPQVGSDWACAPRTSVFAPALAAHVVVGAAATPIVARMRVLAATTRALANPLASPGPPPDKLGYSIAQAPRPVGAAAAGIVRALQFSRPSLAVALGARPPSQPVPLEPTPGGESSGAGEVFAPSLPTRSREPAGPGGRTAAGRWPTPPFGGSALGYGAGRPPSSRAGGHRR